MLYRKHLHPWLLIYLILTIALFLSAAAIIVLLNINQINGFNLPQYPLIACPPYTYLKLQINTEIILRISFILAILSTLFALGQLIFIIYQFIVFRKFTNQNDQDEFTPFKQFKIKKLIFLYFLNTLGLLSLVPLFGSYLAFYIQFRQCNQQSNFSQSFLIPWIIGGVSLLTQLILLIFTIKFFYHYRQEEINQELSRETALIKQQKELKEMQGVKKRILDSRKKDTNKQSFEDSTDQDTPRDIDVGLLDKTQYRNANAENYGSNARNDSIYRQSPIPRQNPIYHHQNKDPQHFNVSKMSPNSISAKQKQLLKTLPKHPFKQYKIDSKFSPTNVIFQENYSLQNGSFDQNQQFDKPQHSNQTQGSPQKRMDFQRSNNPILQQQKNMKIQAPNKPKVISPHDGSLLSAAESDQYVFQGTNNHQQVNVTEIFRQRYMNSPYLKDLKEKNITPQERRKLKKPFLKLSSGLIQYDAQKDLRDNFKKLQVQHPNKRPYDSPKKSQTNQKLQYLSSQTPKSKKLSKSRSTAYYIQKSLKQGKKAQNQNPISNYVNDDEIHEDQLNRIMDFQKISKRRRRTFASNPFFPLDNNEDPGKLYLHKNKHDNLGNSKNNPLDVDQQDEGFDPFKDEAYDDQIMTYRGLLTDDQGLRNSGSKNMSKIEAKKLNSKELQTPVQTKKPSRKDGQLLDFIRSKHVID